MLVFTLFLLGNPHFSIHMKKRSSSTFKVTGYGYSRQECVDIATDFAVIWGKRQKDKHLTIKWLRVFLEDGLNLVLKPRSLEHSRAKSTKANIDSYFGNLSNTMKAHGFLDKSYLIFNVDDKGLTTDHKPPHIVAPSPIVLQPSHQERAKPPS